MGSSVLKKKCALALVIGGLLAAGPAMAGQPDWAGGKGKGKSGHDDRADRRDDDRGSRRGGDDRSDRSERKQRHFEDRHVVVVREYYTEQFRTGRCPPGLAKKRNGCMPPGQAKKWRMGRPLPREVIYYDVPQPLVLQIGAPPPGYRYVRVSSDILMIATGTGMVVDAIQNLGR
jgi:Ni/Co efflux regulator RcnB